MEGVVGFFDKMRDEIPDLVIEDCSSGGHRLAPGFLKRVSQASFSDAHETLSIPIIAASLHRLMPPRQSQIWAVLHRRDSLQRLTYSLSAGFLGRLCLSGEIFELSDEQWERVLESIRFYQKAAPVIRQGATRLVQHIGLSWEHPQGAQAAVRVSKDQRQALVVCHSFEAPLPVELTVTLPEGQWQLAESFPSVAAAPDLTGNVLHIATPNTFEAQSFLLKRVD
jgi:alpha-galactosidase